MVKTAVMVSGGGTNLQALIDARPGNCEITAVISSNSDAYALERASAAGIAAYVIDPADYPDRWAYSDAVMIKLEELEIGLVVLAGFMLILSGELLNRYENRIINIHPALIPAFCGRGYHGLTVHKRVLQYGVKLTGATVHFVTAEADAGPIIAQRSVEVREDDTPELLQRRVMEEAEWELLPKAVELFCAGRLSVCGRVVRVI